MSRSIYCDGSGCEHCQPAARGVTTKRRRRAAVDLSPMRAIGSGGFTWIELLFIVASVSVCVWVVAHFIAKWW